MAVSERIAAVRAFIADVYREQDIQAMRCRIENFIRDASAIPSKDCSRKVTQSVRKINVCAGNSEYTTEKYYHLFDAYTGNEPMQDHELQTDQPHYFVDVNDIPDLETQADILEQDAAIDEQFLGFRQQLSRQ